MSILYLLIPISMLLLGVAVWAFFWAVKRNQFDDLDNHSRQIIFEDQQNRARPHDES